MTERSRVSDAELEALIEAAAGRRVNIGADVAAHMAKACGIVNGGVRTRLLIAHLQEGEEASSIALCTSALERQTKLGFFCHALLNHAPISVRTMRTFIGVVKAAMPIHAAARIKSSASINVQTVYDAMWSGQALVIHAPIANGFDETFDGVLVHTLQPLLHHTTFTVSKREDERVFLTLGERDAFITDDFWVAPPCIMIVGTLEPPKGSVLIFMAKVRRGLRRLSSRLSH